MSPAKYGQHFLSDPKAQQRIADATIPARTDHILEIGPGKGAITKLLAEKVKSFVAVEIDDVLAKSLIEHYQEKPSVVVVNQDFLDFNLNSLNPSSPWKLLGNLPYSITSPLLRKISAWSGWTTAVFMVQKEVGTRLCATPGSKDYGALTVGMNLVAEMHPIFNLPPGAFTPPPKVDSQVIKLIRRAKPLTDDQFKTQRVIQAAFQQRRKVILNSLSHGLRMSKDRVREALRHTGVEATERPENLEPIIFVKLTKLLF